MRGKAYLILAGSVFFGLLAVLYFNFQANVPRLPERPLEAGKPGNPIDPLAYSPRDELAAAAARIARLERELDEKSRALEQRLNDIGPTEDTGALIAGLRSELRREIEALSRATPVVNTPPPEIEVNNAVQAGSVYSLVSVPPLGEGGSNTGFMASAAQKARALVDRTTGIAGDLTNTAPASTVSRALNREVTPYYTINVGATLFEATALSPIIGRVPKIDTQVDAPFRFKLIASAESFAASGLYVPAEIANTIWLGWSVGYAENSCVRGYVDTVTFIFRDGRIVTQGKPTRDAKSAASRSLGYIGDRWNTPCVTGQYISNATDYLGTRLLASGLESMADVWGDAQYSSRSRFDGVETFFTGDKTEAIAAGILEGSAGELADYARERQLNAFDIIFLPLGSKLSINIEQEIEIDYDTSKRKLRYDPQTTAVSSRGFD